MAKDDRRQSHSPVESTNNNRATPQGAVNLSLVFGRTDPGDGSNMLPLPSPPQSRDRYQKRAFLELELKVTQKATFQNGTCSNYLNYLAQYYNFCDEYRYMPFPVKEIVLSMFAQFLSCKASF